MPWLAAAASQLMPQVFGPAGSRAASHVHHHHPASGHWPRRVLGALRRGMPYLRPRVLYPTPWYLWLGLSNLVLRLGWTHRLVGKLEASAIVSLAMALLEVFRRCGLLSMGFCTCGALRTVKWLSRDGGMSAQQGGVSWWLLMSICREEAM